MVLVIANDQEELFYQLVQKARAEFPLESQVSITISNINY
jgi:hypothetical protein